LQEREGTFAKAEKDWIIKRRQVSGSPRKGTERKQLKESKSVEISDRKSKKDLEIHSGGKKLWFGKKRGEEAKKRSLTLRRASERGTRRAWIKPGPSDGRYYVEKTEN